MVLCIIVGCSSKSGKHKVSFNRIPKIVFNQGEDYEELTRERRRLWISAISRDDLESKDVLESERVCGRHFVTGKPAAPWDKYNVDWIPTCNLSKKDFKRSEVKERQKDEAKARAERSKERRKRNIESQEIEAAKKEKALEEHSESDGDVLRDIEFDTTDTFDIDSVCKDTNAASAGPLLAEKDVSETHTCTEVKGVCDVCGSCLSKKATRTVETQTEEFDYMFKENSYKAPDVEFFKEDERVRFYTGLPSFEVLQIVYDHVVSHVARSRRCTSLSSFQEFMIVLIKLRLNAPFQDIAYRFQVSMSTVSRIFSSWMQVMDSRLSCFIHWPERAQLWKTMPLCFLYTFGRRVTIIIDCFEVFIEKPSNLQARAKTFSSYKHHNTIKVLIGITPQGTIAFVSEAWGGRTSDKFITENCGFLEKLTPGDTVMADRGFTISESVGLARGSLLIPAFTKGKSQLDPVDVEKSRGIASVRIHVERVIGLLRRKYTILEGILPTDFLVCNNRKCNPHQVPLIDQILRVCSALVNFCPPIVPFE